MADVNNETGEILTIQSRHFSESHGVQIKTVIDFMNEREGYQPKRKSNKELREQKKINQLRGMYNKNIIKKREAESKISLMEEFYPFLISKQED